LKSRVVITQESLKTVTVRRERWEEDMEEWVEERGTYKRLRNHRVAFQWAYKMFTEALIRNRAA